MTTEDDRVPAEQPAEAVTPAVDLVAGLAPGLLDQVDRPAADYTAQPSRRLEVVSASVALAASIGFLLLVGTIEVRVDSGGVDPRWWPRVLAVGAILASASMLGIAMFGRPMARDDLEVATRPGWIRVALSTVASVLFIVGWMHLDFRIVTAVFLLAIIALFGGRGWKALLVYPVAMTAFIYLLFHTLLRVPL